MRPYLPIGIGFIGMSIPLFISIFYSPVLIVRLCELGGGLLLLLLGFLTVSIKGE